MAMSTIPPGHDLSTRWTGRAASLQRHLRFVRPEPKLLLIVSYSYDRSRNRHRRQGSAANPHRLGQKGRRESRQRVALRADPARAHRSDCRGVPERSAARRGPWPYALRGVVARPCHRAGSLLVRYAAQLQVLVEAARRRNCRTFVIVAGKNYKSSADSRPREPQRQRYRVNDSNRPALGRSA
jgi:hypothetical protein